MRQKPKKIGRPRLPKREAKARIVPIRFDEASIRRIELAAKAANQTVSGWVRQTLMAAIPE